MSEEAAQREARANEMCLNCGSSRWKHHTFAGIGTLCPGNRGAARFPDKKPSPDLVTIPRAELEAALAPIAKAFDDQVEGRDADWHDLWEHGLSVALTIGEIRAVRDFYFHLKGQP